MGKTSTAAQYVQTRKAKYNAVFWVHADDGSKILSSFNSMAIMLNLLDPEEARDKQLARKFVSDWLEDPHTTYDTAKQGTTSRARWLLVSDNVDDESALKDYWPKRGNGAILVTSRDPIMGTTWYDGRNGFPGIQLQPFELDQAVEFLKSIAPEAAKSSHAQDAVKVAKRLDRIPFILRCMGAIIHRKFLSFREFLDVCDDDDSRSTLRDSTILPRRTNYQHDSSTVWALDLLEEGTIGLLNVISLLDPDYIDRGLLLPGVPLGTLGGYPRDNVEYYTARADLTKSSLISIDRQNGGLHIHRTIQDAVRARMDSNAVAEAFENAAILMLQAWPFRDRMWHYPIDHWKLCDRLLPHTVQLQLHCKQIRRGKNAPRRDFPTSRLARMLTYAGWQVLCVMPSLHPPANIESQVPSRKRRVGLSKRVL